VGDFLFSGSSGAQPPIYSTLVDQSQRLLYNLAGSAPCIDRNSYGHYIIMPACALIGPRRVQRGHSGDLPAVIAPPTEPHSAGSGRDLHRYVGYGKCL